MISDIFPSVLFMKLQIRFHAQSHEHRKPVSFLFFCKGPVIDLLQSRVTSAALSHHQHSSSPCPTPLQNAEASLLLSTQSCSTPWPCNVPHYRAVRKLLGALVTLKDWWRKMGWRRGEEQVVKKRMSCLMGCQECNSIIMKSDSGELARWMDGWMVTGEGREAHAPEHAWASSASRSSKQENSVPIQPECVKRKEWIQLTRTGHPHRHTSTCHVWWTDL